MLEQLLRRINLVMARMARNDDVIVTLPTWILVLSFCLVQKNGPFIDVQVLTGI